MQSLNTKFEKGQTIFERGLIIMQGICKKERDDIILVTSIHNKIMNHITNFVLNYITDTQ